MSAIKIAPTYGQDTGSSRSETALQIQKSHSRPQETTEASPNLVSDLLELAEIDDARVRRGPAQDP